MAHAERQTAPSQFKHCERRSGDRLRAGRQLSATLLHSASQVVPSYMDAALQLLEEQYWGSLEVHDCCRTSHSVQLQP